MSLTSSLTAQSAILRANQAEMAAIRANQAQQDLADSGKDFNSIARKENQIEADKIKAQTNAKISKTQLKSAKKKDSKLNIIA